MIIKTRSRTHDIYKIQRKERKYAPFIIGKGRIMYSKSKDFIHIPIDPRNFIPS